MHYTHMSMYYLHVLLHVLFTCTYIPCTCVRVRVGPGPRRAALVHHGSAYAAGPVVPARVRAIPNEAAQRQGDWIGGEGMGWKEDDNVM